MAETNRSYFAKETDGHSYHDELVDYIKLAGQSIIDNADAIVAKVNYISDFRIDISFEQDCGSIPEITVSMSMYPDISKVQEVMEKHHPIRYENTIDIEKEN